MSNCLLTYVCCTFISSSYWNTKSEFPKTSTAKTIEKNHVKKCFKKSLGTAWGRANGSALPTSCGRGFHSRSGSFGLASETKYTTQAHFLLCMDLNSHFCKLIGKQPVGKLQGQILYYNCVKSYYTSNRSFCLSLTFQNFGMCVCLKIKGPQR